MASTGPTWEELMGSDHWKGLLDPLHLSLRQLILRCGDLCQATYDAFNNDDHSKYCGSSRYGKHLFFRKVAQPNADDFEVSDFLYATSSVEMPGGFLLHSLSRETWSKESNWIGYVAVSSDSAAAAAGRREIYVVWRGTIREMEWVNVLGGAQERIEKILPSDDGEDDDDDKKTKVMTGWYTIYTSDNPKSPFNKASARDQLVVYLRELLEKYQDEKLSIIFTGHSLGGALATLSAFDTVVNVAKDVPVCAVVFACPQVGNRKFKSRLEEQPNLKVLHVKNELDLIPHYPSLLFGFTYVGDELEVDTRKSPHLKDSKNPSDWHNLEALLHVVAGWNGKSGGFELKVKRSIALVNKSCDYLKEEGLVLASWWGEKNKGMVLTDDGEWILPPPAEEDLPVPPPQFQ